MSICLGGATGAGTVVQLDISTQVLKMFLSEKNSFYIRHSYVHLIQMVTVDMLSHPLICTGGAEPWKAQLGASERGPACAHHS